MIDSDPEDSPNGPAPARLHLGLAVEAALALSLSALLCWNAWPWIAVHSGTPGSDAPNDPVAASLAAILLYGLAWPAIAAALMGAQRYAFVAFGSKARLAVATSLLVLVAVVLVMRFIQRGG